MARHLFGGVADYVITVGEDDAATLEPGASVTCWSAVTGGTQYTDLTQTDGTTPISGGVLITDSAGAIPEFMGPDGVLSVYLDANGGAGPRRRAVTVDLGEAALLRAGGTMTGALAVTGGFSVDTAGVVTANALVLPASVTTFSHSGKIDSPAVASHVVWRAPKACTVVAVRGYRVGGTGITINAQRNTLDLLATDLSLVTADSWLSGGTPQNASFAVGDSLSIAVRSVAGSPTAVTIQVDFQEA